MSKYGKEITRTLFMVIIAVGSFFLFDGLFTQYNYGQSGRLTSNKVIRYSIIFSTILQAILLFIKHPQRKAVGIFLLRTNIAIIYYFFFIEDSQLAKEQAIGIGIITLLVLMISAYKRKNSIIIAIFITILSIVHIAIVLPTQVHESNIEYYMQAHKNKLQRAKQSEDQNQILSIFNTEKNTKTSLGSRQANQEFEREPEGRTNISYAAPQNNINDRVYITLRDGLFVAIQTQTALSISDDKEYKKTIPTQQIEVTQGAITVENINSEQLIAIKTPNGKITSTAPIYLQHYQNETSFWLSNEGDRENISGEIESIQANTSYTTSGENNISAPNLESIDPYITKYHISRNNRREENTTDRNKGELGQNIIYYKLRLLSLIDKKFKQPLIEWTKIGCIIHNIHCDSKNQHIQVIKNHRPRPNI